MVHLIVETLAFVALGGVVLVYMLKRYRALTARLRAEVCDYKAALDKAHAYRLATEERGRLAQVELLQEIERTRRVLSAKERELGRLSRERDALQEAQLRIASRIKQHRPPLAS